MEYEDRFADIPRFEVNDFTSPAYVALKMIQGAPEFLLVVVPGKGARTVKTEHMEEMLRDREDTGTCVGERDVLDAIFQSGRYAPESRSARLMDEAEEITYRVWGSEELDKTIALTQMVDRAYNLAPEWFVKEWGSPSEVIRDLVKKLRTR